MIALALAAAIAFAPQGSCMRLGGSDKRWYPVNDHTILVSAGLHAYRITTTPSTLLADRNARIIVRFVTSGVVCSPLDLDLQVASISGRAGLIVQSITPLSPQAAERLRHGGPSYRKLGI